MVPRHPHLKLSQEKVMKKILVTGGAGFIGSHLVDALVNRGHKVRVFDNLDPQVHINLPKYLNANAEFMNGDIRNKNDIREGLRGIEIVFHEAAAVGVGQSMYQIQKYIDVNSYGTAKLLDILVNEKHKVAKLIVASSMSIYGEGAYTCHNCGLVYPKSRNEYQLKAAEWELRCPNCGEVVKPHPTSEDKPLYPMSVYAVSKRDQEEMCLTVGKAYGIPTVALRYFNVYGTRQSLSNPYTGVCAIFSSRIKNDKPPIIFEDGSQSRDFVSVDDVVQANLLAMEKFDADYEALNVGTGKPTTIAEIANVLTKLLVRKSRLEIPGKYRVGDVRHCYADTSKIRARLGFKPKVNLDRGMKELVDWADKEEAIDKSVEAQKELETRSLTRG